VLEPLLERLVAWQSLFDSNHWWGEDKNPEGWLSDEAKDQWELEAAILVSCRLPSKAKLN
jgi:hypothetical protein